MTINTEYTLLESRNAFNEFIAENQEITWLAFDTEFITEKRFTPQLCLIQVATENGNYLIDSLQITDLSGLMAMMENPAILKITHAGENDYRIFYKLFGTLPVNVFDTQIADGFLNYQFPMSFKDLVKRYLNIHLQKGYKVSNWSKRPFDDRQLNYALEDVIYLYDLYIELKTALAKRGRFGWVMDECQTLCRQSAYESDPYKSLAKSRTFGTLRKQSKVFLIRLMDWRSEEAASKNMSKKMIMDTKIMYEIAKNIGVGKKALESHRIIPDWVTRKYWNTFANLYEQPVTAEEEAVIKQYGSPIRSNMQRSLTMDLLISLLKYKAMEYEVSSNLIVNRADLNQMKLEPNFFPSYFETGWRQELLGDDLISWLKNRSPLSVEMVENQWIIAEKK
ncbi:MAG: ribonuclease D [Saprospiraceae bacterium]